MSENRYVKAVAKSLGISINDTFSLLSLIKHTSYSVEMTAQMFQKSYKNALEKQERKIHEQAARRRLNPFMVKNKDTIIELYTGSEGNNGLGYAAIKKYFLALCKTKVERKAVPSEKTFSKYLHQEWKIPKDLSRRNPYASLKKKNDVKKKKYDEIAEYFS